MGKQKEREVATKSPFMNPKEAAAIADVTEQTITRLCNQGVINSVRFGRQWRINRKAFMAYAGLE